MGVAIGVDTHRQTLAVCAVDEAGRSLAERVFANSSSGHRDMLRFVQALPAPRCTGIEGSGGLGAALCALLLAAGEGVREVPPALTYRERRHTRLPGKSDPADALAIARVVLREADLPQVRGPYDHRDLKLLVDYRDQLLAEQTRVRNRLHSDLQVLVPGYQGHVGELIRGGGIARARELLAGRQGIAVELTELRLARLEALAGEIAASKLRIEGLMADDHPALTSICGVGALTAARLLGETGDPGRFRSAAAFAMACGAAPIPASSGKTQRVRLNRRGNRQLNRALFTIALHAAAPA
ncbi:MAG TPA: IS110 family transposase [Thermoleophilia bacterium]|nr:IS110 family transposase [Thermoleophilia bacterium]